MTPLEYARCDAVALGELVAAGEVSALELVDVAETIISAIEPQLNAVVSRHFDLARKNAATAAATGPFHGVPFGAKEEGAYYDGVPSGASSRLYTPADPGFDTSLVQRYKQAGLNLVAKLNMPEFAVCVTTESRVNGVCRNPWNPDYTTGGSSGGSAAAVAAGYFPAAYGNDGGGSIRIPSSCCGVFGFKPSRGRVPKGPILNDEWSGNVVDHVITRSVRDSAAILDISAGMDVGAPYDAPHNPRPFLEEVGRITRPLRIGFTTASFTGGQVHPDCFAATEAAAKLCADLGHEVEEAAPEVDGEALARHLRTILCAHLAREVGALSRMTGVPLGPDVLEPTNFALLQRGQSMLATDFLDGLFQLTQIARRAACFFERYDIMLTPTLAQPPVEHGYITTADPDVDRFWSRFVEFIPFTPLANISGQPAMSVPLHMNAAGLPIGVHFQARNGGEATLFQIAGQLETAAPWAGRVPPIGAWTL